MSEQNPSDSYSKPVTGGGLFLRAVLAAAVIAAIGGVIWYMTK